MSYIDTKKIQNRKASKKIAILKGTSWNALEILVRDGFKFLVQLILASLLLPEHFGIIGMAVVFTGLIQTINELGLGSALIQRKENALKEIHYYTAFWSTIIFSSFSFLIMVIIAPLIAKFYNEPLLHSVVIVLSVPILLKPLTLIHRVKFIRKLEFKPIAIIESVASIIAGTTAIVMAFLGFGVWSIALQGIISALITIPLMWRATKWKPKVAFSKEAFKDIFSFGVFVLTKNLTIFLAGNIDYLIIGKLLGSYFLGVYSLAFSLTDIFRQKLMAVLNKVMFPVYSKVQNEPALAGRYYIEIVRYNTLVIFPIMAFMVSFAFPIITIFFGEKWIDSVFPLQILSLAVMFHVATGGYSTVLTGLGKVKLDFIIYLIQTFVITVPLIILGINMGGISGAAIAMLSSKMIQAVISSVLVRKYAEVKIYKLGLVTLPALIGSSSLVLTSMILMNYIKNVDNTVLLIIYAVIVMVVYLLTITPFYRKEITRAYHWIIKRTSKSNNNVI